MVIVMAVGSVRPMLLWPWVTVKSRHLRSGNHATSTLHESNKHARPKLLGFGKHGRLVPEHVSPVITLDPCA